MDPDHAVFLTAQRLARAVTGHTRTCGCSECTVVGKILAADKGLREAVSFVYDVMGERNQRALNVMRALTGEQIL
jgi:hypothetical protein